MIASRIGIASVAVACALGACFAFTAGPALASVSHGDEGSFDGSDRPAEGSFAGGGFEGPLASVAVDRSNGDVWVTESIVLGSTGNYVVDRFDEDGAYAGVQITGATTPQKGFQFDGAGTTAYGIASGIAVDNGFSANKSDVYVADTGHGVVDRFSSSGAFECQITGKTPSTPEEREHECNGAAGSEPTGGPAGIEPAGLAVDAAGDVYVADYAHNVVDVFGPSGEYKTQITDARLGEGGGLGSIALDSAGDLYVTNLFANVVEFEATGKVKILNESDGPAGVTVDPTSGYVYVGATREDPATGKAERAIVEYEPSGTLLGVFGYTPFHGAELADTGVAVGARGRVYAAEGLDFELGTREAVNIYSATRIMPEAVTLPATETGETSATLHGEIEPDLGHHGGDVISCEFEYGETRGYGQTAPCTPATPYSSSTKVSAKLERWRPQTVYHFRVSATDSATPSVPGYGEDKTLTAQGPPTVDHQAAEALQTTVQVRAHINPWGHQTTCQLQYVTDASFQQSKWGNATTVPCSPEDIGSGFGDVLVKLKVEGLKRETGYHYRFLASNQAGLAGHPPGTFETYGVHDFSVGVQNAAGEPETQAGAHPYEVVSDIELSKTTMFTETTSNQPEEIEKANYTGVNTKDIKVDLPPGLIGNPTGTPKCTRHLVNEEACPSDTQVGTLELWVDEQLSVGREVLPLPSERKAEWHVPLFNLEPSGRYAAEFGAFIEGQAGAWIGFHVRTGSDYGVSADSLNIVSTAVPERVRVRVWGVPADPAHNEERSCPVVGGYGAGAHCPPFAAEPLKPLLTNPTSCVGAQASAASVDSWQEPGQYVTQTAQLPGFTGCGKLPFDPSFEAQPTTNVADSPSGLHVDLHVPQPEGCREEAGKVVCEDAEADLRNAAVALPAGVTVDPSSADGLEGCSEEQIGYLPAKSAEAGHPQFTPDAATCPDASKIGSVEVDSPLVDHPLRGAVYVATQDANPFRSLLALYIAVYDPQTGVVLKLPGRVTLDPQSGRLTTTFDENPQLPFDDFKLDLFGGSRGALTTPLACGSYAAGADLAPWSAPEGAEATLSSLPFTVASAPGGGACASGEGQAPNGPGFEAGTASPVAGTYSPFVLRLRRDDASQRFSGLSVTLPPGLIGKVAGVQQCPQGAIDAAVARSREGEGAAELAYPSCPAGSEVGVVHVGTGSGAPLYVTGRAYFAGPYQGAPFSLVIVTPAVAGPFDLGAVVVRAALYIDPNTAQVSVKSDPFPTILDGIPLDVRSLDVDMNRSEFTLNPTSCNAMSVTGQESSTAGQVAGLSDRFQAGGCTTLAFHPVFSAVTSGRTSRQSGASLTVHVGSSMGQANIAKVHVSLPKQLPSRLETLKLACPDRVFAADPASCPQGSAVGTAVARTPILASPLTGPAYLVSHGGAAFPDLEVILQAEGVTIVLDGKTDIKNGITTSTFESIPDAPVSSFELSLPEGPHSILAAPGSLCSDTMRTVLVKRKVTVRVRRHGRLQKRRVTRRVRRQVKSGGGLVMPTTIQGQNGAVIKQNTTIAVKGCATAAIKHRKAKRRRHSTRSKHG